MVSDANVFISALRPADGRKASASGFLTPPAREFLDRWLENEFLLLASISIAMEIAEVLDRELGIGIAAVEEFVSLLRELAVDVPVLTPGPWIESDPDDDKYIAVALEGHATHLVTSDGHILRAAGEFPFARMKVVGFLRSLRQALKARPA